MMTPILYDVIKNIKKMTSNIQYCILIILISILIVSCESISGGSGTILVTKDNSPVDSAQIILLLDGKYVDTVYSDQNGKFQIEHLVSCIPKCPESRLLISKIGYQTVDINLNKEYEKDPSFHQDSVKIFLSPLLKE